MASKSHVYCLQKWIQMKCAVIGYIFMAMCVILKENKVKMIFKIPIIEAKFGIIIWIIIPRDSWDEFSNKLMQSVNFYR